MRKRAVTWQEMMRLNLELRLVPIAAPARTPRVPLSFAGRDRNWLDHLPEALRARRRPH